ncbi:hypothetical protein [Spirillospora sp. NPDC047279]|uniref:hypothetical protein n=1 Tax=Spirillospora sp. NPDC047279 TaxID=3155478 RepID=UPI0033ED4A84
MAAAVITATAGGFAQSYAGLYHWALEHGLRGWKAESFPLLVDLFIIVGELGLFLLAVDAFVLQRRRLLSWVDFSLPLAIALAGWTASLIFNVGHVGNKAFSFQATAAVPPIVSMLGLFVLLRTLHRYVSDEPEPEPRRDAPVRAVALHQVTLTSLRHTGPMLQIPARTESVLEPGTAAGTATARDVAAAGTVPAGAAGNAADVPAAAPTLVGAGVPRTAAFVPDGTAAANGSNGANGANGHHPAPEPEPEPEPEPIPEIPPVDQDNLRTAVIETLERHRGNVATTLAEVTAKGYVCDEDEVERVRANHWFPYAVFRLMARHQGDGDKVASVLEERGVPYDPAALEELVRSWRA